MTNTLLNKTLKLTAHVASFTLLGLAVGFIVVPYGYLQNSAHAQEVLSVKPFLYANSLSSAHDQVEPKVEDDIIVYSQFWPRSDMDEDRIGDSVDICPQEDFYEAYHGACLTFEGLTLPKYDDFNEANRVAREEIINGLNMIINLGQPGGRRPDIGSEIPHRLFDPKTKTFEEADIKTCEGNILSYGGLRGHIWDLEFMKMVWEVAHVSSILATILACLSRVGLSPAGISSIIMSQIITTITIALLKASRMIADVYQDHIDSAEMVKRSLCDD